MINELLTPFANTDIYIIDQILRQRLRPRMTVLDIACGSGRNIPALLDMNCSVTGIDINAQAIESCQQRFPEATFHHCDLSTFHSEQTYDFVIANAIFHFASDHSCFELWADNAWNALASGGIFFARLSTTIALPPDVAPAGFTFLASEQQLRACEQRWQAQRIDPLKTTLVEQLRTMTTWVLQKP